MSPPHQAFSPNRVRLPVEKLDRGLFVAELDRPWLDTPFLIEGLLVHDASELETFRRHCRFVYVDLERSNGAAAEALRDALVPRASTGKPRHEPALRVTVRDDARNPIWRLFERLRPRHAAHEAPQPGALGAHLQTVSPVVDAGIRPPAQAAALDLPAGTTLHPYPEPVSIEAELPRAKQSWTHGAEALRALLEDIRGTEQADVRNIDSVADDLVASMTKTPDAMMWVARVRDQSSSTYHHCLKVAIHLIALGRHIGLPREDLVRLGQIGMLADIGKIRLPSALLEKPGTLTPAEYQVVKRHVRLGVEALHRSLSLDPLVEQGILQHHERIDGSGYPQRLQGRQIGLFGRMAAIVDCFAALTSKRPYGKPVSAHEALMQMYEWCETSFHGPLLEQFVQAIGIFPVGSLVELSNGEAAIVLKDNRVRRLEPRVLVLAGTDHRPLARPFERDLLDAPVDDEGRPIRIARGLPAGAYGLELRDFYASEHASLEDAAVAGA